jgi:hypothetical protein
LFKEALFLVRVRLSYLLAHRAVIHEDSKANIFTCHCMARGMCFCTKHSVRGKRSVDVPREGFIL